VANKPSTEIIYTGRYNHKVERFKMKLRGTDEVWEVSINHTLKAVRINDVVLNRNKWQAIARMGPENARKAIKTAMILDGEITEIE
jgi:hypothetical protein